MLTVLYRDQWGSDSIHEAIRVRRVSPFDKDAGPCRVEWTLPDNSVMCIEEQRKDAEAGNVPRSIFVMNEHGATVATYGV